MSLLRVSLLLIPGSHHRISLSRDELKAIFDSQIKQIIEFIDQQIQELEFYRSDLRLSYLFLAGGLGSSKYVQDEIVNHCKNLRVLFAPDPEDLPLAVCKGLVTDRLQHYSDQLPVIPIRSTNTSYGIICREVYTKKHSNQYYTKSQLDGNKYAENQIDWILVKGNKSLRGESVTRSYTFLLDPSKLIDSWGFTVVSSTLNTDHLPSFLDGKGAKVLCHVTSVSAANLRDGSVNEKRIGLIGKKSVYYQVHCKLSARISPGNMEFTYRIAGQDDDQPQSFTVHWPPSSKRHGDDCVLIRSCDS
ncbi:hypothetical protein BDZ45DRAFT_343318 [Acephala macrosclerotiorum]|nr:hypothetical protein BDZ45DRAFT_343318 [Acephala macrosclerotiorum]